MQVCLFHKAPVVGACAGSSLLSSIWFTTLLNQNLMKSIYIIQRKKISIACLCSSLPASQAKALSMSDKCCSNIRHFLQELQRDVTHWSSCIFLTVGRPSSLTMSHFTSVWTLQDSMQRRQWALFHLMENLSSWSEWPLFELQFFCASSVDEACHKWAALDWHLNIIKSAFFHQKLMLPGVVLSFN